MGCSCWDLYDRFLPVGRVIDFEELSWDFTRVTKFKN